RRLTLERLLVGLAGFLDLTRLPERSAEPVVCLGILRERREDRAISGDCVLPAALSGELHRLLGPKPLHASLILRLIHVSSSFLPQMPADCSACQNPAQAISCRSNIVTVLKIKSGYGKRSTTFPRLSDLAASPARSVDSQRGIRALRQRDHRPWHRRRRLPGELLGDRESEDRRCHLRRSG